MNYLIPCIPDLKSCNTIYFFNLSVVFFPPNLLTFNSFPQKTHQYRYSRIDIDRYRYIDIDRIYICSFVVTATRYLILKNELILNFLVQSYRS